ncbi:MAG: sulfatase-like hydrolase/transferase, partial [Planctomycetales bacterium]|nr:sulfatase-like hydrolase/transferase [Planctomycetales bacterium]
QEGGYRTAFFGKWHLMPIYDAWTAQQTQQAHAEHTPQRHGFDVNIGGREWGQPKGRGLYFSPFDMPGLESAEEGEYLTDRLTDEAVKWLESSATPTNEPATSDAKPFFLYLSYYSVHAPVMARAEDAEHFRAKMEELEPGADKPRDGKAAEYAAMHRSVDQSVGRVIAALERLGVADNTVIVFTGDNGGDRHWACGGLRGRKGLAFEGGVREPTCVVWPGRVKQGSQCDHPIIGMDFYPTFLEMAGLESRPDEHRDGRSLVSLLEGGDLDRDTLYWHYPHYHRTTPYGAVRHRDLKLIEFYEDGELMLFDLAVDPQERSNLAAERPAQAQELLTMLRRWREEVGAQMPVAADRS